MGKRFDEITPEMAQWIEQQKLFFVSTAPLAADGLLNCSPKGMDSFRILGPHQVAYLDLTGSGIETIAHVQENGRIVFLFCAFTGPPKIVRLHGTAEVLTPNQPDFESLRLLFPAYPGIRAILRANLNRIGESCGYSVPKYEYVGERDTLLRWTETKNPEELIQYRCQKNTRSLEGLPGLNSQTE